MFAALSDDGRKDRNAFFTLVDEASKLVPRIHPRNTGSVRPLSRNRKLIGQ
jgi:hypothetical protein